MTCSIYGDYALTSFINTYETTELKKKTIILLLGVFSVISGLIAFSKHTEWELELEFKAKSEKQIGADRVKTESDNPGPDGHEH